MSQVILAFRKPFWPDSFFDVVCPDCFIPEFWVTAYPATSTHPATAGHSCMTGFVAGARAEGMSAMSQTSIILKSLAQLDQIFGAQPIYRFTVLAGKPSRGLQRRGGHASSRALGLNWGQRVNSQVLSSRSTRRPTHMCADMWWTGLEVPT